MKVKDYIITALLCISILLSGISLSKAHVIQGEKGEQGETGAQGPQGERGETGLTGAKGAQGEQGIQGAKGEQGETGVQGPQGERGEKGEQGIQGEKGDKGEDGLNIAILCADDLIGLDAGNFGVWKVFINGTNTVTAITTVAGIEFIITFPKPFNYHDFRLRNAIITNARLILVAPVGDYAGRVRYALSIDTDACLVY